MQKTRLHARRLSAAVPITGRFGLNSQRQRLMLLPGRQNPMRASEHFMND